jgi:hypothetical protein
VVMPPAAQPAATQPDKTAMAAAGIQLPRMLQSLLQTLLAP